MPKDEIVLEEKRVYARKYYAEHKAKLLAQKKEKYETDAEYRKGILERNTARKKRLKEERAKNPDPKVRGKSKPKVHVVTIEGRDYEIEMITMGRLAQMIGKGLTAIHTWESKGWIPLAIYKSEGGARLYTKFQALLIAKIWESTERKFGAETMKYRLRDTEFIQRLKEAWEKYPYGVDLEALKSEESDHE